eukprot:403346176
MNITTGEFKPEKISLFQKALLVRWINTLDIWDPFLNLENIIEQLQSGVLLCLILKFHQPNLDLTGMNQKARARKQCLNNIEKALSILYQKGASPRYIPTADDVFDGDKNTEKVWLMLNTIFDLFAMHDVRLLTPKIVKWINKSLMQYGHSNSRQDLMISSKSEEIYHEFKSGVILAYVLGLYVENPKLRPDFREMFEHPQNRSREDQSSSSEMKANSMGVIDEVDSVDFSSTMKSGNQKYSNTQSVVSSQQNQQQQQQYQQQNNINYNAENMKRIGKINQERVQQFLSQANSNNSQVTPQRQRNSKQDSQNEDDGNVYDEDDEDEVVQSSGRSQGSSSMDLNIMKQNLKHASQNNIVPHSQQHSSNKNPISGGVSNSHRQQASMQLVNANFRDNQQLYQVVSDENVGIFNTNMMDQQFSQMNMQGNNMTQKPASLSSPRILNAEIFMKERMGFFQEDLRHQLLDYKTKNYGNQVPQKYDISEDQLTQMYYSSVGNNNTTAQFINQNNFSTHGGNGEGQSYGTSGMGTDPNSLNNQFNTGAAIQFGQVKHSKSDSLMGGNFINKQQYQIENNR